MRTEARTENTSGDTTSPQLQDPLGGEHLVDPLRLEAPPTPVARPVVSSGELPRQQVAPRREPAPDGGDGNPTVADVADTLIRLAAEDNNTLGTVFRAALAVHPTLVTTVLGKGGRALVTRLVEASWSNSIANVSRVFNVLGYVPTGSVYGVSRFANVVITLLGIPSLLLGGLQSLVGRIVSAMPGSHRDFVKDVIVQEHGVAIRGSWSEGSLRRMYAAFALLPPGHVRNTTDVIDHNEFTPSSDFSNKGGTRRIGMARLPTSLSMGGAEPLSRAIGQKFLSKGSKYSDRMRDKNAFTMTVLHEVGHAVDGRLGIMTTNGHRPEFGGWRSFSKNQLVDRLFADFTGNPEVRLTAAQQAKIAAETAKQQAAMQRRDAVQETASQAAARRKRGGADQRQGHQNDVDAAGAAIRKTQADAVDDAWLRDWEVERSVIEAALKAHVNGRSMSDAVATHPKTQDVGFFRRRAIVSRIEAHPIYTAIEAGKGSGGWNRTRDELAQVGRFFGGRAYHQSYKDENLNHNWESFLVDAKNDAVSHYQWRAPGEWFAELYAHYYLGTIDDHPLYGWFRDNVDKKVDPAGGQPRAADQQQAAADAQVAAPQARGLDQQPSDGPRDPPPLAPQVPLSQPSV